MTTIGVGGSEALSSLDAGRECAHRAVAALTGGQPAWVLAFCGGRQRPEDFLAGLREFLGPIPVVGGAGVGAMSRRILGTSGYECAIAVFPADLGEPRILALPGLDRGERALGQTLGAALRPGLPPACPILLFYDSVRAPVRPPALHVGSYLLDGLYDALGAAAPLIVGAGTLSDFELTDSYVFDGQGIARHTAVAIQLPDTLEFATTIMHGCTPASDFLRITRIEGAVIHELDGQPAAMQLAARLGTTTDEIARQCAALGLTLGEKQGDPFAPFDEGHYVNRLVVHADPESGAIVLFEADYRVGSRVQVMLTDPERMGPSVAARTRALLERVPADRPPLLGLYIDCVGRAAAFSGAEIEEAEFVRRRMGDAIPWLGVYSGVEIAPVPGGRSRPLDWTGVLALIQARAGS